MINLPKKAKVFLILAIIVTFTTAIVNIGMLILLSTNLFGAQDAFVRYLVNVGYDIATASDDVSFMCIESGFLAVMNILYGTLYLKHLRKTFRGPYGGAFRTTFAHMLFGSFLGALLAMIGLRAIETTIVNRRPRTEEEREKFMNDYRMEAMKEAVTRLKELKTSGAISEEEYYEALNKILES